MCDTMVSLLGDSVRFAKNSDRDPGEAQNLHWLPAQNHRSGSRVACTWIDIEQVERTNALLLSRPWWIWGAEMGANEHGVVIGNEAVFTTTDREEPGLLGMDLLRLALERAASADEAAAVIVELLERHGQGGACSYEHRSFRYDNSFLVADRDGAIVVETAGREWATERVVGPGRSISNALTIDAFARAHTDRVRTAVARGAHRRRLTQSRARSADSVASLIDVLRSHGSGPDPAYSALNGAMAAPCMHAGGLLANSQTTASWISDLSSDLHWVTGTSAPCTSLFTPVRIDEPVDLGPDAAERFDPRARWWRHERLHRLVMANPGALLARYRAQRDLIERQWVADPPCSADAFRIGDVLRSQWTADVAHGPGADVRPAITRAYWWRQNRRAGIDEELDRG